MRVLYLGLAALLSVSACAKDDKPASESGSATATTPADRARAAALTANAIEANPAAADSILKEGGYTRDGFQKLMYEIAGDSAMSAQYASAKAR